MNIIVAGDYCQRYRLDNIINNRNFGLLFDKVAPMIKQADYSIVNFEFPIVLSQEAPIHKCGPNLRGDKAALDAIQYAGFNVCTLANNHILDQGEKCCIDTMRLIEESGMESVGVGVNLAEAGKILYLHKDDETLAVINCCEHEFSIASDITAGANPLNPIQQYYKIQEAKKTADYVLVIVHGGHEHFQLPSLRMKELFHFFIEVGADVVVNHHQHCYSGYEVINGKPIFYGIGNFCFDHVKERSGLWNEGYIVQLTFNKELPVSYELVPYIQSSNDIAVQFLSCDSKVDFFNQLSTLNQIIADDRMLKEVIDKYYDSCADFELNLLEPYDNVFLSKLYRIGLLPKIFKGNKKYAVLNHILCESHRDKLIYALAK